MRCTTISGLAAFCLAVAGMQSRCAAQNPIPFPTKADGYEITKTDKEQPAPAGYEGTSDISTEMAVGNTPATAGKRVKATFTLSNQIRTCPLADGTAEGTGLFAASIDFTDQKANETNTVHVEMSTKAKYKGQVGDDALLQGQVNADIDYTYSQTGGTHDRNGAILSNPQPHFEQHVTIPVLVLPGMESPSSGPSVAAIQPRGIMRRRSAPARRLRTGVLSTIRSPNSSGMAETPHTSESPSAEEYAHRSYLIRPATHSSRRWARTRTSTQSSRPRTAKPCREVCLRPTPITTA